MHQTAASRRIRFPGLALKGKWLPTATAKPFLEMFPGFSLDLRRNSSQTTAPKIVKMASCPRYIVSAAQRGAYLPARRFWMNVVLAVALADFFRGVWHVGSKRRLGRILTEPPASPARTKLHLQRRRGTPRWRLRAVLVAPCFSSR